MYTWVDPKLRGVLSLADFHVPRRLRRTVRNGNFDVTCNTDFAKVVAMCAETTPDRTDTWINPSIECAVNELHRMGFAHCVECRQNGELVGGIYGISLGAAFFGESMFSRARDASKVALVYLVARLKFSGYRLLDTQFITDHLAQFGAIEIPARDYLYELEDALKYQAAFPDVVKGDRWTECLRQTLFN
jgi:leucyl/phenylalanyl-tRNA--protein transferase